MKVKLTPEMLRAASRLKIISCATTGSDHIAREGLSPSAGLRCVR
jgi:phosphoglycerate dehydrogenase-like enzyme